MDDDLIDKFYMYTWKNIKFISLRKNEMLFIIRKIEQILNFLLWKTY